MILIHLGSIHEPIWQSDRQVVSEPVDRVLGSGGFDTYDGQVSPVRKLPGEQPSHQGLVNVQLVGVHLLRAH